MFTNKGWKASNNINSARIEKFKFKAGPIRMVKKQISLPHLENKNQPDQRPGKS